MNIVVADDEPSLSNFVKKGLNAEGHYCESINLLHELIPYLRKHSPDLLILDRMFMDEDSLALLPMIKALPTPPLVLMLSALDEVSERIDGLMTGADDYLCKPFDFDELLARITVLARRANVMVHSEKIKQVGRLQLLTEQRVAKIADSELSMTKLEFDLLLYLVENLNKVVTRERIIARVWHEKSDPLTNVVDVYISKLRKILSIEPVLTISTLRGSGYRLSVEDEA